MARALERGYGGRVLWLDSPGAEYLERVGIGASGRIIHVKRMSARGILAYITAEATFFTHGLFGVPPAVPRKPTINLWHGEAIKNFDPLFPDRHVRGRAADFHIGRTTLLGERSALVSSQPAPRLLATGYPRTAQLLAPCSDEELSRLGIDPSVPFVVWMPTFRRTRSVSATPDWSDTTDINQDLRLAEDLGELVDALSQAGIGLVIKPHPLDTDSRAIPGCRSIRDADLIVAGVPFYSVLGRSAGLITDFSSVGNEYLATDRPLAFHVPDRAAYAAGRGLYPSDALEHVGGPILDSREAIDEFVFDVLEGSPAMRAQRAEARDWFGSIDREDSGQRILSELSGGRSRLSRSLRRVS